MGWRGSVVMELKVHKAYDECGELRYYDCREVDAVLAKKDKEIERIKTEQMEYAARIVKQNEKIDFLETQKDEAFAKLESLKASHYAEMVDAGMRERRLRRAFYKACANWACVEAVLSVWGTTRFYRWKDMLDKCRAMAKKYGEGKV